MGWAFSANSCAAAARAAGRDLSDGLQAPDPVPDPSNGTCKIVVTGQFDNISIVVTDLLGKQLVSIPNADATTRLDLKIDSGIYLVKLTSGDEVLTKRLVVTR